MRRPGRAPQDARRAAVEQAMRRLLAAAGADAESRWCMLDGRRIHYLEAGAGPAVVLIHGAGGGAANWFGVLRRLAGRFRVLAPDLPGFGLSDPIEPRDRLGPQVAEVVDAWLRRIGVRRPCLAGTSFGGLVALRLAQRRPDGISRLALIDSAGLGAELPALVRVAAVRLLGRFVLRPSTRGTAWLLRRLLTSGRPLDPDVEPALLEYLLRSAEAADRVTLERAYRLFCGPRGQREVLSDAELGALAHPTLVIWGRRDAFFPPSHAERAAARIPGATVRWIADAGHSPNWEAPDDVARALEGFCAAPPHSA